MDIEIIAIGDEVLFGYTANSNGAYVAQKLLQAGFETGLHHVVGDDPDEIKRVLKEALKRSRLVITTGGLGPTVDDRTRQVISELFSKPLELNEKVAQWIEDHFGAVSTLQDQAQVIKGAQILYNRVGTAPGFCVEGKDFPGATLIAFPGVPAELHDLVEQYLIPIVQEKCQKEKATFICPLYFAGILEAEVDQLLQKLEKNYSDFSFGIYPRFASLVIHIRGQAANRQEFEKMVAAPKEKILAAFGKYQFEVAAGKLEEAVAALLTQKKLKLACAESCTGGSFAARFVAIEDASLYFQGGVVAYSNEAKIKLLQVKEATLDRFGAVSCEVTEEMAQGALTNFQSDVSVAISGILGPKGGTPKKPVGTVAATILVKGHKPASWVMHLAGSREAIREKAIEEILSHLFFIMKKNSI